MINKQEGVITIFDRDEMLKAIIYKDMKSRKNIIYKCEEMSMEEISQLIENNEKTI